MSTNAQHARVGSEAAAPHSLTANSAYMSIISVTAPAP
jgi:hypothetical protein